MAVITKNRPQESALTCRNAADRKVVRWYVMSYPYGRKGLTLGLEQELERRRRDNEPLFEYFAPTYVESREVDGRLVNSTTALLYNYFFVHACEDDIFKLKKNQPQYNLLHRITNADGSYYYPYVEDGIIRTLQWIADSYSGCIPLCLLDPMLLNRGDRVRIIKGQFKGVEATLVTRPKSSVKEVMVLVDNWMCVPLMNVRRGEYEVIRLNDTGAESSDARRVDNPQLSQALHEALCRHHRGEATAEDRALAERTLAQYSTAVVTTSIARCKLYSLLLPACTILGETEKLNGLVRLIQVLLPTIKAEQSLALLMVTLYGCTDNCLYLEKARALTAPWQHEPSPKKGKQNILKRLTCYNEVLDTKQKFTE